MQEFKDKLQFALDKRGLNQTALANLLGVTTRQIRNYITGKTAPDLNQLASVLQFPVSFFTNDDELPEIKQEAVSFRSHSRTPQKLKKQAYAHCVTGILLNQWFEQEFELQQADLPDYSDLDPEHAAMQLRLDWGLGDRPIGHLISLLESKGIRVFSLSLETREVDAFCTWHDYCPYIFLNTQKSAERSRFDAAHELGHLIRDRFSMVHSLEANPDEPRDNIERNANQFASAFLMPAHTLWKYRHIPKTIDNLIQIKKEFGVSLVALSYRMRQLDLISEWTYVQLCKQFNYLNYRKNEPESMPKETSISQKKMLSLLQEERMNISQIAKQLNVSSKDISDLMFPKFNLIRGGGIQKPPKPISSVSSTRDSFLLQKTK